ncbi:Receptor-type tyrosine-protein phosphatase kappa [Portunus trituberculatus]|uniref:Receptor-type tyrosine-protein phosphatase kappa n=1 Tax=Portunus trituberculatus TaxID=210409 RepID=A0A5B7D4P7_PORTR|nr:Receptor-type tyrosine-protein phosphatase kappa [Portunus trituberculatus]
MGNSKQNDSIRLLYTRFLVPLTGTQRREMGGKAGRKEAEEDKAIGAIPTKPIESKDLSKICAQHRRYPVLYKVEFQLNLVLIASPIPCSRGRPASLPLPTDDYNRVVLDPLPDAPDSDYINASYVDSLLTPKAYIATQGPLENTIVDFWRMVWQQKTRLIVMLTKTFDFIKVGPAGHEEDFV